MDVVRQLQKLFLSQIAALDEAITEAKSFEELEERIEGVAREQIRGLMRLAVDEMDRRFLKQRDSSWKVLGFRSRTLLCYFGELRLRRRLYEHKETGETRFFVDEALGLPPKERWSPKLKRIATRFAMSLTYGETAELLGCWGVHISKQSIWKMVQHVGDAAIEQADERHRQVYEEGSVPDGQRQIRRLRIESDGTFIKLQRSKQKQAELKLFGVYEGRRKAARHEAVLKNRRLFGTLQPADRAWEECVIEVAEQWNLDGLKRIDFGGDGAAWVKKGPEHFPGVESRVYLDTFHLRRALLRGLSHDEKAYTKVAQAIVDKDWPMAWQALERAYQTSKDKARKRVKELATYLQENWSGLQDLPKEERLGVMEALMRHAVTRRMKRQQARWSMRGGEVMVRLRVAHLNDELDTVAQPRAWQRPVSLPHSIREQPLLSPAAKQSDAGDWLAASLPVLAGPHQGRPWVRQIMRHLAHPHFQIA